MLLWVLTLWVSAAAYVLSSGTSGIFAEFPKILTGFKNELKQVGPTEPIKSY